MSAFGGAASILVFTRLLAILSENLRFDIQGGRRKSATGQRPVHGRPFSLDLAQRIAGALTICRRGCL